MIDAKILPLQKAALQPVAEFLAHRGVKADQISLVGFLAGLGAFAALCFGYFLAALLLILVNRALDGLDGAVARIHGPTDRGAYLDIALDMVFYALIPLGFALLMAQGVSEIIKRAAFLTGDGPDVLAHKEPDEAEVLLKELAEAEAQQARLAAKTN